MLPKANGMEVMNTYYHKKDKHKVTYQKKDNIDGGPPRNTNRYSEIDHCLIRRQWSNPKMFITADPRTNINTDRSVIKFKIRQN